MKPISKNTKTLWIYSEMYLICLVLGGGVGGFARKKKRGQFKTEYNFSYLIPPPSKLDLCLPSFQTRHCSFLSFYSPPQTSHFYLPHLYTGSTHPIPALLSVEWAGWPGNTKNRNSSSYESFLLPAIYIIRTRGAREKKKHTERKRKTEMAGCYLSPVTAQWGGCSHTPVHTPTNTCRCVQAPCSHARPAHNSRPNGCLNGAREPDIERTVGVGAISKSNNRPMLNTHTMTSLSIFKTTHYKAQRVTFDGMHRHVGYLKFFMEWSSWVCVFYTTAGTKKKNQFTKGIC